VGWKKFHIAYYYITFVPVAEELRRRIVTRLFEGYLNSECRLVQTEHVYFNSCVRNYLQNDVSTFQIAKVSALIVVTHLLLFPCSLSRTRWINEWKRADKVGSNERHHIQQEETAKMVPDLFMGRVEPLCYVTRYFVHTYTYILTNKWTHEFIYLHTYTHPKILTHVHAHVYHVCLLAVGVLFNHLCSVTKLIQPWRY
jgi:hypothetical protein